MPVFAGGVMVSPRRRGFGRGASAAGASSPGWHGGGPGVTRVLAPGVAKAGRIRSPSPRRGPGARSSLLM